MARMRVFIVLVLAITAGGGLALATYNYMQKLPGRTVTMPTKSVVVAATDLDLGTELRRDDIRIIAEGLIALDAKVERFRPPAGPP